MPSAPRRPWPTVDGLLADPDRLEAMGRAAAVTGPPDAADAGAGVVEANAPDAEDGGTPVTSGRRTRDRRPRRPPTVHVVGIGGAGMSAIATVLRAMGHKVTGSDLRESAVTERLRSLGIAVAIGHAAANVGAADLVTVSSAVPGRQPRGGRGAGGGGSRC